VPIGVTEEELDQQIHPLMQTVQTHDWLQQVLNN
jgi:hypothetical protein